MSPNGMRSNQGRGACLEEFEGGANVVKATSAAYRTPVHYDHGWFCELDEMVDVICELYYLASRQLDMGNSGLSVDSWRQIAVKSNLAQARYCGHRCLSCCISPREGSDLCQLYHHRAPRETGAAVP